MVYRTLSLIAPIGLQESNWKIKNECENVRSERVMMDIGGEFSIYVQ